MNLFYGFEMEMSGACLHSARMLIINKHNENKI